VIERLAGLDAFVVFAVIPSARSFPIIVSPPEFFFDPVLILQSITNTKGAIEIYNIILSFSQRLLLNYD
jgi:hypothetical protein